MGSGIVHDDWSALEVRERWVTVEAGGVSAIFRLLKIALGPLVR